MTQKIVTHSAEMDYPIAGFKDETQSPDQMLAMPLEDRLGSILSRALHDRVSLKVFVATMYCTYKNLYDLLPAFYTPFSKYYTLCTHWHDEVSLVLMHVSAGASMFSVLYPVSIESRPRPFWCNDAGKPIRSAIWRSRYYALCATDAGCLGFPRQALKKSEKALGSISFMTETAT